MATPLRLLLFQYFSQNFFKKCSIPGLFQFIFVFSIQLTVNTYKWLDSKCGLQCVGNGLSANWATATSPQFLPRRFIVRKLDGNICPDLIRKRDNNIPTRNSGPRRYWNRRRRKKEKHTYAKVKARRKWKL